MSGTYTAPIRIGARQGATFDGTRTNASSLSIGDNTGAATVSQELFMYTNAAAAGNLPFYRVGVGGTFFNNGAVSIPAFGTATASQAQVIATIPAGSRLQFISVNLEQAPTAITGGALNFALNGTNIGSYTVTAASLTSGLMTWTASLAASQLQAYVGATDAVLTVALAGTGITGGILAELSVNYTPRNLNGTIAGVGTGQTQ